MSPEERSIELSDAQVDDLISTMGGEPLHDWLTRTEPVILSTTEEPPS